MHLLLACGLDPSCHAKEWIAGAVSETLTKMAEAVKDAVTNAFVAVGTMWVNVPSPELTGGTGAVPTPPGEATAGIETVLGYVQWISLFVAVASIIVLGVRLGSLRRRDASEDTSRFTAVLTGVLLISAATGITSRLMPAAGFRAAAPVRLIQNGLWWYTAAGVLVSILIGAARMAWEQRADPGKELVRSLLTFIFVSGAGLSVVGILVKVADAFSKWILSQAVGGCDVSANGTCFKERMSSLIDLSVLTGGGGQLIAIILGIMALLASLVQILLMVMRGGMLLLLAGILPLAASATNTEMGRAWFKRGTAWLIAFILYKPAAAIVYATAFALVGQRGYDSDAMIKVLTGLMLMLASLVALPALMRFVMPMVGAVAAGSVAASSGPVPTGTPPTGSREPRGSNSSGPGSGSSPGSANQASGAGPGGSGMPGASGSPGQQGSPGSSGQQGAMGRSGSAGQSGSVGHSGAVGQSGAAGQAGTASTAGQAGAAGSAGSAGAGAGAAGGAAAAAGPVGIAVAAGSVAYSAVSSGVKTAAGAAESSAGE